jgi:hypothetical protein
VNNIHTLEDLVSAVEFGWDAWSGGESEQVVAVWWGDVHTITYDPVVTAPATGPADRASANPDRCGLSVWNCATTNKLEPP